MDGLLEVIVSTACGSLIPIYVWPRRTGTWMRWVSVPAVCFSSCLVGYGTVVGIMSVQVMPTSFPVAPEDK
jgi:hypothetical protein